MPLKTLLCGTERRGKKLKQGTPWVYSICAMTLHRILKALAECKGERRCVLGWDVTAVANTVLRGSLQNLTLYFILDSLSSPCIRDLTDTRSLKQSWNHTSTEMQTCTASKSAWKAEEYSRSQLPQTNMLQTWILCIRHLISPFQG